MSSLTTCYEESGRELIPNLQDYLSPSDGTLTWNPNWVSDFESPWSIFEKLKFTNLANKKDIFNLFGTSRILSQKTIIGNNNHDLYQLLAFDPLKLQQKLGFDLIQYNKELLILLTGFLRGGSLYTNDKDTNKQDYSPFYLKGSLSFCLDCLQNGYHSILHQFELFRYCPFHLSLLYDQCPSCNESIPYALSDLNFPYTCTCGFKFKSFNSQFSFNKLWRNYSINEIKDLQVLNWLSLSEKEKDELGRLYIYPFTDISKAPELFRFFLECSKKDYKYVEVDTDKQQSYSFVSSSSYIQKLKSPINAQSYHDIALKQWKPSKSRSYFSFSSDLIKGLIIENLVETKYKIINAFGNHLKKTILRNHTSCIRRLVTVSKFTNNETTPICPFAYAYVKWKQSLLKIDNDYDVDNRKYFNIKNPDRISSLSVVYDQDPLTGIIDACANLFPLKTPENHAHFKWLISHITWSICNQLFISWLDQSAESKWSTTLDRIWLEGHFFAFRFPENDDQPFYMFWDNRKYSLNTDLLKCPFDSVRLRRKTKSEMSFHPMIVAMRNYNEWEKESLNALMKRKHIETNTIKS